MDKKISKQDKLKKALNAVSEALNAEVVLYNGPINEDGYGKFVQATGPIKPTKRLILFLTTYGGSADSAYRIARYAQNFFEDFVLFAPSSCKSAGLCWLLGHQKYTCLHLENLVH